MPGPKSTPSKYFKHPVAKPNRKAAARLKRRQKQYDEVDSVRTEHGMDMHRPGSMNRNK